MSRPRRDLLALGLSSLAALAAVLAIVTLYLRQEVADRDAFADRAVAALQEPTVRDVVAREIVVGLLERGSPDLVTARPLLESAVGAVVGTDPFRALVRGAALQAHSLLFDRGNAFVLDLADTGTVVISAVRSLAPDVAARLPAHADATLIDLRDRPFADDTLRAADKIRTWALVLPFLALGLLAAAVAVAPDRGRALTAFGLAVGVVAIVAEIALATARTLVLRDLHGTDAVPTADLRTAVGSVWDAFLGDLGGLLLIAGVVGFVLAAGVLSAIDPDAVRRQVARVTRRPTAPAALGARGVTIAVAGLLVLLEPDLALRILAYVLGAGLVYVGSTELLTALGRAGLRHSGPAPAPEPAPGGARRRLTIAGATAVLTLVVASGAAALVLREERPENDAAATPAAGCNGSTALCSRRLNEVLFPGTHNSMGAADVAGWSLPDQRRSIPRQLKDGIRLFLLDPHYGRTLNGGRVQTDFAGEGRDANKVAKELDDGALVALDRLGVNITRTQSGARGPREVWLCHTVCELGATRLTDVLTSMRRYLVANPGVVVELVLESYVTDASLREAFEDTDTVKYAATLDHSAPLPTLGELVADGTRMVVFTEHTPSGTVPWLNDGFSWIQDTPLGNRAPGDFACQRFRGTRTSPMLMLNHWIERFPPSPTAQRPILTQAFLERRIAQCEKERGMPVSGIAVDYYDEGDVVRVAAEHNAKPVEAP
ncbi:hypothetical protein DSM104299_03797 [Baekduia alba]|uniref:hypothetical protein n=1 Tax=Baekduia alba TaxID=2997333 RepID=UPI0023410072|nr:hypothetical protein [Baekduia alba]WCB95055.1 hypothetical protein DSM104299_03797 [Baekduia alba]